MFAKQYRCQEHRAVIALEIPAAKIRLVVSVIVLTMGVCYSSLPAVACKSEGLDKEASTKGRLAVRSGDEWRLFNQQEEGILKTSGNEELCLAWEAPPYAGGSQIVYVSTRYRDDQPVSIYRNASSPPFFYAFFSDWRGPTVSRDLFDKFHKKSLGRNDDGVSGNTDGWDKLRKWHETSFWIANLESHELVKGALAYESIPLPYGAERLLVVAGERSMTSWIPFTSKVQKGSKLLVAISYSGDKEPFVYEYVLNTERGAVR